MLGNKEAKNQRKRYKRKGTDNQEESLRRYKAEKLFFLPTDQNMKYF